MDYLKEIERLENICYSDVYREAFDGVLNFIDEVSRSNYYTSDMIPIYKSLLFAFEKEDNILIGDCLEFGLRPLLNGRTINKELFSENNLSLPDIGENIFLYASYSDEPILCVRNKENDMIRLNSFFSPQNEVDKWFSNLKNFKSTTPIVCLFGLGTGLFAETVLNKLSTNGKMIIYEPDRSILDYCISCGNEPESDISEKRIKKRIEKILNDKRVSLVIEDENSDGFSNLLSEEVDYIDLIGMVVIKHNRYDMLNPKSYLKFLKAVNNHRTLKYTNKNTVAFFKDKEIEHLFRNLRMYRKCNLFNELSVILPDNIPAIIVAAGPSLEKNVEVLRQAKGHCLIFAVDTAVRYLLKKGIIPDLVITIDAIKPAEYFPDALSHSIPCIFDVTANPEIVNKHTGRCLIFNNSNLYMGMLFETIGKILPLTPNGGSVATSAFEVLYVLNQKKIIMVGQDLASSAGNTHAGGVNDNAAYEGVMIEGIYGDQVVTRADWLSYLKWFEMAIDTIKKEKMDIRVIDATEGGAKIHGSEIMTLQEALDECKDSEGKLPEYNFEEQLNKLEYYLTEEEYGRLIKSNNDSLEKLKEIAKKAEEAIRICNTIISGIEKGTVSGSYVDKEKKKIAKINEWCSRSTIFALLNDYMITDIVDEISYLKNAEGDIKTREINGIKLMKISFEAMVAASRKIYSVAKEIEKELGL